MRDKFHVLIVKDEPMISASWQRALELAGYYVTCTRRGEAALQRLECERIDVLVVDPSLSDMPSNLLTQRALERRPQLRVMLLAGTDPSSCPRVLDNPDVSLLSKPANPKTLKKHLGQLLQQPMTPLWKNQSSAGTNVMRG